MLLQVHNACFSYAQRPILQNISFCLPEGSIFCIVGRNGCGKTTLLDCVMGMHRLQSGKILLLDKQASDYKPRDFASHVAYVPQAHAQTFPYTVLDVVVMGRTHAISAFASPGAYDRDIAMQSLVDVGMEHLADRLYTELSGGELQMVLLARALAQQPKLIVMDEPTAHLDFKNEWEVLCTIASLVRDKGLSILMATHFLNQAFFLQNAGTDIKVALMDNANFKQVGSADEVLTEKNLLEVYDMQTRVIRHAEDGLLYPHIIALHPHERGSANEQE